MYRNINNYPQFYYALQTQPLVYLFGTGISSALTGQRFSWRKWIDDGIKYVIDFHLIQLLEKSLNEDDSTDNMIDIVGKVLTATKADGTYTRWMKESFEAYPLVNADLSRTLKKLLLAQDIFATTNYDLYLEKATGLGTLTYQNPKEAYEMLDSRISTHVLHIHGAFDSVRGIDNIIADRSQYKAIIDDEGAQFIQNILGTKTLVFVGCGKTTEDANISRFIQFANRYLQMSKEYYFLHRAGDIITGLPDNVKLIEYGDNFSDLPLFLESMAYVRMAAKIESNPLVLRTAYSENTSDADDLSQYYFANEYLQFCGRKVEMAQLLNFIESDRKISWWAITGQAGAGKSRLAYELLHRLPNGYYGFFLNCNSNVNYVEEFKPFTNTLIVIDYVKGNEWCVAQMVSAFIDKYNRTDYNLRILFIERDNLLLYGSWFDVLKKSFNIGYKGVFLESEYNVEIASGKHRFLYLDDLDTEAILQLIGEICRKNGLQKDTYRDKNLKEDYAKKFETLRFRPLFLQLYVQAWVENGCNFIEYRNYTALLDIIIDREQDRILRLVSGEVEVFNSLIHIIIRACVTNGLLISDIPMLYTEDWNNIKKFAKAHSVSGTQRSDYLQSLIGDAAQEIVSDSAKIEPKYPDIIKEYMFLTYIGEEELERISQELWGNYPQEYNSFLIRCISDFHNNKSLTDFIRNASAGYDNINALQVRLALLQNKVVHDEADAERLLQLIQEEFDFWCNAPINEMSPNELRMIQLQGFYYSAHQLCGWSLKDKFFEAIQKIASYDRTPEFVVREIAYLIEFAHYLTEKNAHGASEDICQLIDLLIAFVANEQDKKIAWLSLQREHIVNLVNLRKWDEIENLHDKMFDAIDWTNEKQVELYAYTWFSTTKKCQQILPEGEPLIYAEYLQDLASDYAEGTREIFFNDKIHYYYLHSKAIENELVLIGSALIGLKPYGVSVIDGLIDEIERNIMIPDFSGVLIYAKALKVGFDDSVTDTMVKEYLEETDALLKRYPDNALLAEKSMLLWELAYAEHYKTLVPKYYVDRAYILLFRFVENRDVLDQFYQLLNKSSEKINWQNYVKDKQVVSHLYEYSLFEYLYPSLLEQEPIKRVHPKVGANDPCPCGSGKKFKKCCRGKGLYD